MINEFDKYYEYVIKYIFDILNITNVLEYNDILRSIIIMR